MNPEFRQTLNTLSHNLEHANQAAQENIYTFTQLYIDPCLSGLKSCLHDCTAPCFPSREDTLRRKRGRPRGRAEYSFDFYDDWDDEEIAGNSALVWGDDELDSLLAGGRSDAGQPRRQRAMSYGSKGRRSTSGKQVDVEQDPTVIPSSSYLGFLERLPWKIGRTALRYQPSAADLQENPGGLRIRDEEVQPLIEEDEDPTPSRKGHGRQRSDTATSRSTTNSLSSRGDLIMSDEEDDAVPLDDEFAVALSRRMTSSASEDQISGRMGSGKRPEHSRRSTRTVSSKSNKSQRSNSLKSQGPMSPSEVDHPDPPTMQELRREEEQVRKEEEMEIAQKREVAQRIAVTRGFSTNDVKSATTEVKPDPDESLPSMAIVSPRPASPESVPERGQPTPKEEAPRVGDLDADPP